MSEPADFASAARVLVVVEAGILPGHPEPLTTKRWTLSSREWHDSGQGGLDKVLAEAEAYAASLRDPRALNWVRTTWYWL